ncbi:MAG TPA: LPXTG cell wall anchor domain-containing protein, partial [Jatrophihabitans sp.]|nr:LPXTG cell wall anchor domain-containing protein [Jatrophihabitans sp.]
APGSPDVFAVDTAPVTPLAVLSISKRLASYANNLATYQITVHNAGPNPTVKPITVTDKLPAGLVFKSATGTGWSCGTSGGTVSCLHPASLAVGANSVLALVTVVTAAPGTSISNTATVSGGTPSGHSSASQSAVLSVTATGSGSGSGSGSGLPNTGRNTETPAGLALGLLLVGLGLLVLSRRPRRA